MEATRVEENTALDLGSKVGTSCQGPLSSYAAKFYVTFSNNV
jgi:hypothetical protein